MKLEKEYQWAVLAFVFAGVSLLVLLLCSLIAVGENAVNPNAFYFVVFLGLGNFISFCFIWLKYSDKLRYFED